MKRFIMALAVTAFALPAAAADLGGNCCADLEERVAELEAITARKGTRKMSLTISGQINKALMWHDIDGLGGNDKARVIDNANSPSLFRIQGDAKLSNGWSAGFLYEFGVDSTKGDGFAGHGDDLSLRHAAVWLGTPVGKIWLGQTSTATDGVGEITVANTAVAARMLSLDPLQTYSGLPNLLPFDGNRLQTVKYESPALAGFTISVAYAPGEASLLGVSSGGDVWDAALRYAGEHGGFRMAAGIGVRQEDMVLADVRYVVGSASAMHMATGVFVNLAAGNLSDEFLGNQGLRMAQTQVGIERNFFGIGATTLFGEYARAELDVGFKGSGDFYGAGIVQAIDGLSADLYAHVRMYDIEGYEAKVGMMGLRIKF